MGIQNLLRFLANSTRNAHISEFEDEFVAIDAYCWLHKGIYSCAFELAMKKPTVQYVTYCMRYIEMLLHFRVKPILVFDGRQLSSKSETEKKRREERKRKYEKGKQLMRAGKTIDGRKLLSESVDVTHELALNLMKECRRKNIDCIVAPFEADAQLAFLSINKVVKCVITEDSDLLVYGCDRVMFKMDTSGRGQLIEKSEIHFSLNMTPEEFNEDIFRYMCILIGCDYLPSLPSIGPVYALKFIKLLKGNDIYEALPKLPIYVNKMNIKVPQEYLDGFRIADNTFKHQLVYDPFRRLQVPLRPVQNDDDVVGTKLPEDLAFHLAVGNIDPITMKKVDNFDPDKAGTGFTVLWKTDLLPNAIPRHINLNCQLNEAKKRQRENLESDAVGLSTGFFSCSFDSSGSKLKHFRSSNSPYKHLQSVTNDLKKHCTPPSYNSLKDFPAKNAIQRVPKNGFIFSPKIMNENKDVSKKADESRLLKSRYFSTEKDKRKDKMIDNVNDRRKDESYEDYLQRLYDEFFPAGENKNKETEAEKDDFNSESESGFSDELCSSCRKFRTSCSCFNKNDSVRQKLCEFIENMKGLEKNKEKFNQHFLLDEIYKNQADMLKNEDLMTNDEVKLNSNETDLRTKSPDRTLSVNLSNMLSEFDFVKRKNSEGQSDTAIIEKENAEVIGNFELVSVKDTESKSKNEEPERSPSPVFKIQKENKVLKRNFRFGNTSDTTSTPISVYFSSSGSLNEFGSQASLGHSPLSSNRKISSSRGFNSVPAKLGKNAIKSSSVSKTLFQFGFKKERRSENELKE